MKNLKANILKYFSYEKLKRAKRTPNKSLIEKADFID